MTRWPYNGTRRMDVKVEPSDSPGNDEATTYLLKDVSGSMNSGQHLLADTVFWRFEEALDERYGDVATTYILFGSEPRVMEQETFYGPHDEGGGSGAAAALERVAEQAEQAAGDTYLLMAGDGFYDESRLYERMGPSPLDVSAHIAVYAEQAEGVETFRVELDERWTYEGVVTGPDGVDDVYDDLKAVVDETLNG